ncbi:MCE family protein [Mycolicibacterium sp. HS_4_1]
MHLDKRVRIQLVIFAVIALTAVTMMSLIYMQLPAKLFGIGRYVVKMELPETGGIYATGNVTYRGTVVGRVQSVGLTPTGVQAELSLNSGTDIPSDVQADVHSQMAIGEQFVSLTPRGTSSRPLKDGDVIPLAHTSVPPDINTVIDSLTKGLQAVPKENLKTVIDESATAVGGLGPELSHIVKGGSQLAIDARANLDPLLSLIDQVKPVLDSQNNTSGAIQEWAANLATVTGELQAQDKALGTVLDKGGPAFGEMGQLFSRLQPTLPVLLQNLVSINRVAITYQPNLEQLLVLLPRTTEAAQGVTLANRDTKQAYKGAYLSFNLNLNLPPPCTTGYLPAQQMRNPALEDYPELPAGDLYCRTPQDGMFNVRGAKNLPCETVPGKRAATVKQCESNEPYVPLNDGYNWKGDPNATWTGQDVPQLRPGSAPPAGAPEPPPVAVAEYDPASGTYIGPDGKTYTQADLAHTAPKEKTWQSMMTPQPGS